MILRFHYSGTFAFYKSKWNRKSMLFLKFIEIQANSDLNIRNQYTQFKIFLLNPNRFKLKMDGV